MTSTKRIDIGGYELRYLVEGEGSLTVILEAGAENSLISWKKIQSRIAEFTRVLSYDRAGLGESDPSPHPRSAEQIALELHKLLERTNIPPPYILVGHSFGAILIRVFTMLYPEEVSGMIFVDPSYATTNFLDYWRSYLPPEKFQQISKAFDDYKASRSQVIRDEWKIMRSYKFEEEKFPDIPVFVLTSIRLSDVEERFSNNTELVESWVEMWQDFHKEWIDKLPSCKQIITEKSGHNIHDDEPELVVNVIRQILDIP
ncbi:MAG: alpha/beta fold hydrolase [Promethearchaeota archaeon]